MLRLIVNPDHPEPRKIRHAVEPLGRGGVVAYPTDTVYGLGCDYADRRAVEKLYAMKGMKARQPLAFLLPDLSEIARFGVVTNAAHRLMRRLVPGPYTFILDATHEVPKRLMIEQNKRRTVGVRVPDNAIVQAMLREHGRPILSSSAVGDDKIGIGDPDEVKARYEDQLDVLVDGGLVSTEVSTVLSLAGDTLEVLREGKGPVPEMS